MLVISWGASSISGLREALELGQQREASCSCNHGAVSVTPEVWWWFFRFGVFFFSPWIIPQPLGGDGAVLPMQLGACAGSWHPDGWGNMIRPLTKKCCLALSILFIKLSASEWQLSKCLRVLLLPEQAWVCGRFQVLRVGGVSLEWQGQAWSRGEDFFTLTFLMQCLDLLCGLKAMSTDMAQEQDRPSSAWQRTSESLEGTYQSISEVMN